MLVELQLRDFAIIDRLTVPLSPGFNVLTGETGTGKSILIDALGTVLGARTGSEVIRDGAQQARVEAAFAIEVMDPIAKQRLTEALTELGIDAGEETLVLTREIHGTGRTVARVNGRIVPAGTMQRLGELLVDIHGQNDHQSLLRPQHQLDLLDRFAALTRERVDLAAAVAQLRKLKRELGALSLDERELNRRVELLQFQVNEIDAAGLMDGEEENLTQELRVLGSAEKLATMAKRSLVSLERSRDEMASAVADARQLHQIDEAADQIEIQIVQVAELLDDAARALRLYESEIEISPERLADIEKRLELIAALERKYGESIAEILEFASAASDELAKIESSAERREQVRGEISAAERAAAVLALRISERRSEAAAKLGKAVERELADLGFNGARFEVAIRRIPAADGLPVDDTRIAFDETGIDRAEFLLAANPVGETRSLAKVASGGETSRIMLALKTVLARVDPVPTLIFDEVDVGIGGRTGNVVGEKLWQLSSGHQVLCVTHLPQVASFADHHLNVVKLSDTSSVRVGVTVLSGDARVTELANMLGGATNATKSSATELIERAGNWKAEISSAEPAKPKATKGSRS